MKVVIDRLTLDKMATGTWVPPIKRLAEHPTHEELRKHHERETAILMQAIRTLAILLLQHWSAP